jgi:tRNA-Thr(GGU) m(6)t(6)A37 methyltransferase TsaA
MDSIQLEPIGRVVSPVRSARDDRWGDVTAEVRLDESRFVPEALAGLSEFSHVEVIFVFHQIADSAIVLTARHPRENPQWPKVGIFAQRGRVRPNRLGATICEIVAVEGLTVKLRGLDAFDGSPVLDIKPVMAEFLPELGIVRQPQWSRELMASYF